MLCIIFGEIPEDMEKKYVYNTSKIGRAHV